MMCLVSASVTSSVKCAIFVKDLDTIFGGDETTMGKNEFLKLLQSMKVRDFRFVTNLMQVQSCHASV